MRNMYTFNELLSFFPFSKVKAGEPIILYGLGNIGISYLLQIRESHYCTVAFAVDKDWQNKTIEGVRVQAPATVLATDARIVVAIGNERIRNEIVDALIAMKVRQDRIIAEVSSTRIPTYRLFEGDTIFKERMIRIRNLLKICEVTGHKFARVGNKYAGGYLMLDTSPTIPIAYSFGIDHDVSWDADMSAKGYDVYMYDHTIDALPEENEKFHFFKIGIADSHNHAPDVDILDNLLRTNGHQNEHGMILKMDVEGAEWGFIDMTSEDTLSRFDQIIFEMHDFLQTRDMTQIYRALEKLNRTHGLVHVHVNNGSNYIAKNGRVVMADCLEVTYANKKTFDLVAPHSVDLPIENDSPCDKHLLEPYIGDWNDSTWIL